MNCFNCGKEVNEDSIYWADVQSRDLALSRASNKMSKITEFIIFGVILTILSCFLFPVNAKKSSNIDNSIKRN